MKAKQVLSKLNVTRPTLCKYGGLRGKMSKEELIEYARAIKDFCKETECKNCPFLAENEESEWCALKTNADRRFEFYPSNWDLPDTQTHEKSGEESVTE